MTSKSISSASSPPVDDFEVPKLHKVCVLGIPHCHNGMNLRYLDQWKVNRMQERVSLQLRYRLDAFQKSSPPPQWAFASPHLRSGCTTWQASSFPPDSEQILHDLISYIQGLTWIMMNLIPIFVWPKASFWKVSSIKVHAFSPALLCYKTAESLSVQVGV